MKNIVAGLAFICGVIMFSHAHAADHGLAQPFDWQEEWGKLDLTKNKNIHDSSGSGTAYNSTKSDLKKRYSYDPKISSVVNMCAVNAAGANCSEAKFSDDNVRHGPKFDIKNSVILCRPKEGTNPFGPAPYEVADENFGKIRGYKIDFDGDGRLDVILDPTAYFKGVAKTHACPVHICNEEGCNIPFYRNVSDSNIKDGVEAASNPCPSSAAANTTCRSECAATMAQCPHLFVYQRHVALDGYIMSWSFISPQDFLNVRETTKTGAKLDKYIYREPLNANPVLKVRRSIDYCNFEERDVNPRDGELNNEPCNKYMQYSHKASDCEKEGFVTEGGGCFVDLYTPTKAEDKSDNGDRFIVTKNVEDADGYVKGFFKYQNATLARAEDEFTDKNGNIKDVNGFYFELKKKEALASQLKNFGGQGFQCREIRNTSDKDIFIPMKTYDEFSRFLASARDGEMKKIGVQLKETCDVKFTDWVGPKSCGEINLGCNQVVRIAAERKCVRSTSAIAACAECANIDDPDKISEDFKNKCEAEQICKGATCATSNGGHAFCVAGDTNITMADGSEKKIADVKVGEQVMAFDTKKPGEALKPATVRSLIITGEQGTISLNDLKITAVHKVVMKDGRLVEARQVKIGDEIMIGNGSSIKINKILEDSNPITVYNLDLQGADGYVAGGLRVLDYYAKAE